MMTADLTVRTYTSLANVEKIFKAFRSKELGIRPVPTYNEDLPKSVRSSAYSPRTADSHQ